MSLNEKILIILILFINIKGIAQYQITIDAILVDKETKQPISFANIEFINKGLYTISDTKGNFQLIYDEEAVKNTDILQFTKLGYDTLKVKASQVYTLLKNTKNIYLIPYKYNTVKNVRSIQNQNGSMTGIVSGISGPIGGALIKVKNSLKETRTDEDGRYYIDAVYNEVLEVSFFGMKPKRVLVKYQETIDIFLEPEAEALNEVIVRGEVRKEEKLNLGLGGEKNYDAVGYSLNIMTSKDIKSHYYNLADLLQGKFAGVHVGPGGVWLRGGRNSINNPAPAIYDIDGMVYKNPPFIDPQNIESIIILKSLAATVKYGSVGRGGVIVIRTKSNSESNTEKKENTALIKGNDYTEQLPMIKNNLDTLYYIKKLKNTGSITDAIKVYQGLKKNIQQYGIPFYINTADFFLGSNSNYTNTVLSEFTDAAFNNPKALKTLAYKYEELGKLIEAKQVYQHIAGLLPNEAQTYRDLALIYNKSGDYKSAIELYKKILSDSIKEVDFSGIRNSIENEVKHLLKMHRREVDLKEFGSDFLNIDFKYDIRIVIEWNDSNSEFNFQFVNPTKKYFTWKHSKFHNQERMLDEIRKGYHLEEFVIDDSDKGEWIINIERLSEEPILNPTFIKYTIYKNYGFPHETKTIKLINLQAINQKVTIDKFLYR